MHFAVPVIGRSLGGPVAKHVQVAPAVVERLAKELFGIDVPKAPATPLDGHDGPSVPTLECFFDFMGDNESAVPLLLVGGLAQQQSEVDPIYFGLAGGLPGAVPITHHELLSNLPYVSLATFRHYSVEELTTSSSFMDADHRRVSYLKHPLHEAVAAAVGQPAAGEIDGAGYLLKELAFVVRKRTCTLKGLEHIIGAGSNIDARSLKLDFAYHSGTQEQSVKRYFDIEDETARLFLGSASFHGGRFHGAKVLSRYGTAVFVGCAVDEDVGCAAPFWHPVGCAAAQLAPIFQPAASPNMLDVGRHKLEINGPSASSLLLNGESLSRYISTPSKGGSSETSGVLDESNWLNAGLFGRPVGMRVEQAIPMGQPLADGSVPRRILTVAGVQYNWLHNALEQVGVEVSTGEAHILP